MDGVTQKWIAFGGIGVAVPPRWYDITDEVEADDPAYTLADSEGVGALQFSIALYREGVVPDLSCEALRDMVLEFGEERDLGEPFEDRAFESESLRGAGMSFRWEDDFIRVWYVSDRKNLAFITYVCEWDDQGSEILTCESIVRSLLFRPH